MQQETILEGYSDAEKGAYLSAIAAIATADHQASDEEQEAFTALAESADLSETQMAAVQQAADDTSGAGLQRSLDVLKGSELRFSLVADLIAFAKSDANYTAEEEEKVKQIGEYLGVNNQQFGLLNEFAEKNAGGEAEPQQALGFGGLGDKMKSAGINTNGLLKGLLAVAGPIILSRMMSRGGRGGGLGGMLGGALGGGLGGMLGGNRGGLGGMLGGNAGGGGLGGMLGGGGLGSLIGMLSGGRGYSGAGGLLGKVLGGRF